ncbi:hypothetical protein AX16_000154 [Volvariella volvacea WC 439]|nr:hypothetical protein AX16_000154 [Volvariella volvacea WC 439]
MSLTQAGKHVRPVVIARRYASTKAPQKVASHRTLPSAKMRALISLYHQADGFITPENLSQRIDEAFLSSDPQSMINTPVTVKDLNTILVDQRAAPKLSQWEHGSIMNTRLGGSETSWSSRRSVREQKVIEALYGVDLSQPNAILPGLEVLEESKEAVERTIREDLEAAEADAHLQPDLTDKL